MLHLTILFKLTNPPFLQLQGGLLLLLLRTLVLLLLLINYMIIESSNPTNALVRESSKLLFLRVIFYLVGIVIPTDLSAINLMGGLPGSNVTQQYAQSLGCNNYFNATDYRINRMEPFRYIQHVYISQFQLSKYTKYTTVTNKIVYEAFAVVFLFFLRLYIEIIVFIFVQPDYMSHNLL